MSAAYLLRNTLVVSSNSLHCLDSIDKSEGKHDEFSFISMYYAFQVKWNNLRSSEKTMVQS